MQNPEEALLSGNTSPCPWPKKKLQDEEFLTFQSQGFTTFLVLDFHNPFCLEKIKSESYNEFIKVMDVPDKFDTRAAFSWREREFSWFPSAIMDSGQIRQYIGNTNVLIFFVDDTGKNLSPWASLSQFQDVFLSKPPAAWLEVPPEPVSLPTIPKPNKYSFPPSLGPFDSSELDQTGQMCHCFIIIHAFPNKKYRVNILHRPGLTRPFGPPLPANFLFDANTQFRDYLLTKGKTLFHQKQLPLRTNWAVSTPVILFRQVGLDNLFLPPRFVSVSKPSSVVYNAQMSVAKCPPTNIMYKAPRQHTMKELAAKYATKLTEEA